MLVASSSAALAADEVENNAPIQIAQPVSRGADGSISISASVSTPADVDYYSFQGTEGEKMRIDIDGGVHVSPLGVLSGVDTFIGLFGPAPADATGTYDRRFHLWADNDDNDTLPLDEGSAHKGDSLINEFRLPSTGTWIVGVSRRNGMFFHGGAFGSARPPALSVGTYTLVIAPVEPPLQLMNIDVKPGSEDPSPVNPKAKGVVPVALLGSAEFNVKEVDVSSMTFGHTGDEKTLRHCQKNYQDFNKDGFLDLLCHFENGTAGFVESDTMGTVKGKKVGNKAFKGTGRLKVKPAERE
jgi:hypothetical protein